MAYKQIVGSNGVTPNPKVHQKDNEKIENLAIDLQHGLMQNRTLGFQVSGESLIEGLNQAADLALIKRIQLRTAKYLKIVDINYRPYGEYHSLLFTALNTFLSAVTEIIVDIFRGKNPILFKKPKYYTLIDDKVKMATQELFRNLEPLSKLVNESGYNGL